MSSEAEMERAADIWVSLDPADAGDRGLIEVWGRRMRLLIKQKEGDAADAEFEELCRRAEPEVTWDSDIYRRRAERTAGGSSFAEDLAQARGELKDEQRRLDAAFQAAIGESSRVRREKGE